MKYVSLAALLLSAASCRYPDNCVPGHTRCDGQVVQICDSGGHYQQQMDCAAVSERSGQPYSCQYVDDPDSEANEWEGVQGFTCEIEKDAVAQ